MPLIGRTITISSRDPAVVVEAQDVDAVELALADPGLEHEHRDVAVLDLRGVAEVLEDLDHRPSSIRSASRPS